MDRRGAVLGLLATFLGWPQIAREPGILTIDLSQWRLLRVKWDGKELEIPPHVIFEELTRPNQ